MPTHSKMLATRRRRKKALKTEARLAKLERKQAEQGGKKAAAPAK